MRALTGLAALALVAPLLAGCSSEKERYCDEVTAQQEKLSEIAGSQGGDALIRALPSFRALQEKAPSDIRDEWDVVVRTVQALADALDDAGLDPATYDANDLPADVAPEDRDAIVAAATDLGSREMVQALAGVEQQVRDVCHTPLAL